MTVHAICNSDRESAIILPGFLDDVGESVLGMPWGYDFLIPEETTMYESLISRIRSNRSASGTTPPFPVCSEAQIELEEKALGFKIHPLLRALYLEVGDGGFGPGFGIIGVTGGHESDLGTLAQTYRAVQEGAAYNGDEWLDGLLPFCGWGCNIFSCVDCSQNVGTVYQSEECDAFRMNYSFEDVFEMWLAAVPILDQLGKTRGRIMAVDPATGQKYPLFRKRRK